MRQINIYDFIMIVFLTICVMIFCFGCQQYSEKEYYENGQIKREVNRNGVPNWSKNKKVSYK